MPPPSLPFTKTSFLSIQNPKNTQNSSARLMRCCTCLGSGHGHNCCENRCRWHKPRTQSFGLGTKTLDAECGGSKTIQHNSSSRNDECRDNFSSRSNSGAKCGPCAKSKTIQNNSPKCQDNSSNWSKTSLVPPKMRFRCKEPEDYPRQLFEAGVASAQPKWVLRKLSLRKKKRSAHY